jgi:hypothetical protein
VRENGYFDGGQSGVDNVKLDFESFGRGDGGWRNTKQVNSKCMRVASVWRTISNTPTAVASTKAMIARRCWWVAKFGPL